MSFKPHGKHLVAGEWVATEAKFRSEPAHGEAFDFSVGTVDLVNAACEAAEEAFWSYGYTTREERAAFLDTIADEIEARADDITEIGSSETGLPAGRLQGERGRTVGQLRLFASHIRKGDYLDRRHDEALPDRQPLPRPDIRLMQRPIGPVAVFGASISRSPSPRPAVIPQRLWQPAARSSSRAILPIPAPAKSSPKPFSPPSRSTICTPASFR